MTKNNGGSALPGTETAANEHDIFHQAHYRGMTARQILEARLGRPLGPLSSMPRDLRTALYLLAREHNKGALNDRG